MKIKIIDNGREREVELSKESAHALKKAFTEEKKGLWKPEAGEEYWYFTEDGRFCNDYWADFDWENDLFSRGDIFPTMIAIEKEDKKRRAIHRVKEYIAREFGEWPYEWWNKYQIIYILFYDHRSRIFDWIFTGINQHYSPFGYLHSAEDCRQLITDMEDDLKIIFEIE